MKTMRKRDRGHPRKYYSFDCSPEFFKIFIPSRNSQQLKIPTAFVKEYGRIIQRKTALKGRDGKLWVVNIEKTDGGVFVMDGWLNFVNHYSLRGGEFLVFKYIGNSTFIVKIFGVNGCKIKALPTETISRDVEDEDESEQVEPKKFCTKPSSAKQSREAKRSQKVPSQCVKETIDIIEEVAVPENPCFIAPVNYKQEYNLHIPQELFSANKVRVRPEMVLRSEKGKEWPIKTYQCSDGRVMFGTGRSQFWKQNEVQPSDSCKFTFLNGGSSKFIKVEILRGHSRLALASRRSRR